MNGKSLISASSLYDVICAELELLKIPYSHSFYKRRMIKWSNETLVQFYTSKTQNTSKNQNTSKSQNTSKNQNTSKSQNTSKTQNTSKIQKLL